MRFTLGLTLVDLETATARTAGGVVPLTANEAKVLRLLAEHRGRAVSRDELLAALGYRPTVVTRAIDQVIFRLRRKLEPAPESPAWLLSEPSSGYRLANETTAAPHGRDGELALLRRLLVEHGTVWVTGLPGAGRRTLAAAAGAAVVASGPGVVLADLPPRGAPHVRVGPLPAAVAAGLLEAWVVEGRGAVLGDDERGAIPARVRAVDALPGRLRQLSRAAVLRPLPDVALDPDPEVDALLARQPALRRAACTCAVFPGPFLPEEARRLGLDEALLVDAWQAGLLERDDDRLALAAGVRAWVSPPPDVVAAALADWAPRARAAADAVTERGSEADEAELASWADRLRGRLDGADWLPVLHALLVIQQDLGPPELGAGPWAEVTAARRAWRRGDLPEARRRARGVRDADLPPGVRAGALRWLAGVPGEEAAARAAALAAAHPSAMTRGTAHLLEGIEHLQGDRALSAASEALLAAAAAFRSVGNVRLARVAEFNLATCAARDGRAREAVGWLGTPRDPDARWLPILLHLALESPEDAGPLLDLQDEATRGPGRLSTSIRGALDLLAGDPGAAVAAAGRARHLPVRGVDRVYWVRPLVAAFGQLALGRPDLGLAALEEPEPATVSADVLGLTRAVLLARAGRPGEAGEALAAASEGPEAAWRPHARALAAAVVAGDAGRLPPIRAAYLASPARHGWFALAWAALRAAGGVPG